MKRILIVIVLMLFDVLLFCWKARIKPIETSFQLKENELAITFLSKEELLVTTKKGNYLWDLNGNEYSFSVPIQKKVAYGSEKRIGEVQFQNNRLLFHQLTFCIDTYQDCDISYLYKTTKMNMGIPFVTFQSIYNPDYRYDLYNLNNITTILWTDNRYHILNTFYTSVEK